MRNCEHGTRGWKRGRKESSSCPRRYGDGTKIASLFRCFRVFEHAQVYGRKIVVEIPDHKGRTTAAFYFTKGRLISLEATVLPANGDLGSPDPALFVDSIAFALSRTEPGAIELETPRLD
jgi:hypothetical protein